MSQHSQNSSIRSRPSYPMARQTRPNELRRSDNRDETVYYTEFDREKYTTDFTREFASMYLCRPIRISKGISHDRVYIYMCEHRFSLANTGSPLKFSYDQWLMDTHHLQRFYHSQRRSYSYRGKNYCTEQSWA